MDYKNKILIGDCLDELKKIPDNSIDSVVTDPPYGLSKEPNIEEVLTKWLNGEDYKHKGSGFMGKCYHPDTEILTTDGWKQVADVRKGDMVCSLNPITGVIEYLPCKETFKYGYRGDLVRITGRSTNQLVTPNHNVYVKMGKQDFKLVRADSVKSKYFYVKNQGNWNGINDVYIDVCGNEFPVKLFFEFLGLFLGDGYVVNRKNQPEKQDFFGFRVKKERKANKIRKCLVGLNLKFTEGYSCKKERFVFYVYDKRLLLYLNDLGKARKKRIPPDLFNYDSTLLEHLYAGLIESDGCKQGKNQEVFYTSSKDLADDFQRLCLHTNRSCTLKKTTKKTNFKDGSVLYTLSVLPKGKLFYLEQNNRKNEHFTGNVYCIGLAENHIVMTRLDGKTVWSGNSWDSFVPGPSIWREVYRVLKPGGHLLCFAGTRTEDLMSVSLRLAGFERRDELEWLYFCLSEDTQCLTKDGWKKYNELSNNDYVMQWNHETNELSWTRPEKIHVFPYDGEMLNFKTRSTDQLVTPNHRMYVDIKKHSRNQYAGKYTVVEAKDLKSHWGKKFPVAGVFGGNKSIGVNRARLLGWWLTDAWTHGDGKACMFSQSKPETLQKLRNVLDTAKLTYSEYVKKGKKESHADEHTFYVTGPDANWLLENYPKRELKSEMLGLVKEERKALVESLVDGDGSRTDTNSVFWSKNRERLEVMGLLFLSLNKRVSYDFKKGCVRGSNRFNTVEVQAKHGISHVPYKGNVWCLTVPTGAFVVRRNNHAFITGNSGFPKAMDVGRQFDKQAGADREVVGYRDDFVKRRNKNKFNQFNSVNKSKNGLNSERFMSKIGEITSPSTSLAKQWDGWKTALKPAHEPILMFRKPLEKNVCYNVDKYGTGAMNIDVCRIPFEDEKDKEKAKPGSLTFIPKNRTSNIPIIRDTTLVKCKENDTTQHEKGRFPANCVTLEDGQFYSKYFNITPKELSKKASKKDRNSDWEGNQIDLPERASGSLQGRNDGSLGGKVYNRNHHPTVKPIELMAWLIKLTTQPGGIVLDPFAGSGSTLVAAKRNGFNFIGVELNNEYAEIAKKRCGVG